MRLAIYNQELSDHVKTATRHDSRPARGPLWRGSSPTCPSESPRGKVLGALNPNSLRKYSSSAAKASAPSAVTPLSKTKKKPATTPRSSCRSASAAVDASPTSLLESKSSCDGISKALPFHVAVDSLWEESPLSSSVHPPTLLHP